MITCPMCKKKLPGMDKQCVNCKTDVSLLVDYVDNLRDGLKRAEQLTRKGELGDAAWEYLEVLEVDPDNAAARRQVGKVATAVRQFDQTAPGRRWQKKLKRQTAIRRMLANWSSDGEGSGLLSGAFWFVVVIAALLIGFFIGKWTAVTPTASPPAQPPAVAAPDANGAAK